MDVARYADSTGADEDHRYPYAWRYRDYVIESFNRDMPYDRFVREQVAGDLLPADKPGEVNVRGIVATGFLALGPKLIAEQDKVKMFYDLVDEEIDTLSRGFLGLTVACARCHDHKFDPISTKDYYSLASIFASSKQLANVEAHVSELYFAPLVPKDVADRYEAHQAKIKGTQKKIDELLAEEGARYRDALAPRMAEYILAAGLVYRRRPNRGEGGGGKAPGQGHPGEVGRLSEARGRTPGTPGVLVQRNRRHKGTDCRGIPEEVHRDCDVPARGIGKLAAGGGGCQSSRKRRAGRA